MAAISWLHPVSGDWTTGADWSTGTVPGAADSVMFNAAGIYEVTLFTAASAASLTLAAAGATFYDAGSLALSGTLSLQSGTLALAYGTLTGGTLAMAGGTMLDTGGTLDGVHVQGTVDMSRANSALFIRDGLTLGGTGGSGAGSIALTGGYADLAFQDSQTLDHATISFGAAGALPGQSGAAELGVTHSFAATTGATLTLGSSLWLHETGGQALLAAGSTGPVIGATLPDALVNQGTITLDSAGSTLTITGNGTFSNHGTIAVANGATLAIDSAGFSNTGSLSVNTGTLALGGTFSAQRLSSLGPLSLTLAVVEITGIADNTGGTLAVSAGSSLGAVTLAGTILNGIVLDTGGGLSFAPGTGVLDGATYQGNLSLAAAGSGLTLTDGAHVVSSGSGLGTISVTGAGSALFLQGAAETLDSATLSLGNAGQASVLGTSDAFLASTATTATLGAHLTVQQSGLDATLAANALSPIPGFGLSDTLVNQGAITGGVTGGNLAIGGYGSFINQGGIVVSNGDTLTVSVRSFSNPGTISVLNGATAILGGGTGVYGVVPSWSNAGRIMVNGGTLILGGNVLTSQLGSIAVTGGTVSLAGTLSNAGSTLTLGVGATGPAALASASLSGTIQGGTVSDTGGVLAIGTATTALIDGVAWRGTLALGQTGAYLRVRDGLSFYGHTNISGAGSILAFQGTQTYDRSSVQLGAAGNAASIDVAHDYATLGGSTLTLGTGLSITQSGALADIGLATDNAGDAIVNLGTISGAVAGGVFSIGGASFSNRGSLAVSNGDTLALQATSFSNAGTISVTNASLSIGGSLTLAALGQLALSNAAISVAGTLNSTGTTLAIGTGSLLGHLTLSGTLRGGVIADGGLGLTCQGNAKLDGVIYRGTLDLSRPFAQLALADGITLTDITGALPGTILLTGAASRLVTATTQTLDNATIMIGSAGTIYNGQHLAAPELAAAAGTTLTIGPNAIVRSASLAGQLGDAGFGLWSDSVVNNGQIVSSIALGTLTLGSSVFVNNGSILSSSLGGVFNAATGFTNSGTITVSGGGSNFLISLYNYFAAPNAGANVFTNAGTILVQGGLFQEQTSGGLFPAVPIANLPGATIQGYGVVSAQIANAGTIEAKGGALALLQAITGSGAVLIDPASSLEFGNAAPSSEIVTFTNAAPGGILKIDQPNLFAAPIAGFTTGDLITLPGAMLTSVGISSGTLVASTATQNWRFPTTTPLGGALSSGRDGFGAATIAITPQTVGVGGPALLPVSQTAMLFWASPAGDIFQGSTYTVNNDHIGNWSGADTIDITDMSPATAHLTYTQGSTAGTLAISDGTHNASIYLTGNFTATGFHLTSDGHTGTTISYNPHG